MRYFVIGFVVFFAVPWSVVLPNGNSATHLSWVKMKSSCLQKRLENPKLIESGWKLRTPWRLKTQTCERLVQEVVQVLPARVFAGLPGHAEEREIIESADGQMNWLNNSLESTAFPTIIGTTCQVQTVIEAFQIMQLLDGRQPGLVAFLLKALFVEHIVSDTWRAFEKFWAEKRNSAQ